MDYLIVGPECADQTYATNEQDAWLIWAYKTGLL
jgi:hypothetical protein